MKATVLAGILGALLYAAAVQAQPGPTQQDLDGAARSTEWLLTNHDYAGVRYVDLDQITPQNAGSLRPLCMYQGVDLTRSLSNPLVYHGILYLTTTYTTVALDATNCKVRWRHEWKPKAKDGNTSVKNRGAAIKDGRLVRGTMDGYLLALDLETGRLLWQVQAAAPEQYEALNMPPILWQDLVIIGPAGSEYGIQGWIGAFSLADGSPRWRFNTIPREGEPGAATWGDTAAALRRGGGIWTVPSLDVASGLIYVPVGNPAPDFFAADRPGTNLYTNAVVVLDAATGALKWHYQAAPHDTHDWDLPVTSPLFTAKVGGRTRNLLTLGGKDGMLRLLDRDTHEEIYAVGVTTRLNAEVDPTEQGVYTCPGLLGGFEWSAPAYDAARDLLVVPSVDWCGVFKRDDEPRYVGGQVFMGGSFSYDPVEKSHGWLTAVRASTGEVLWKYPSSRPMVAAVTATRGSVLFTGELTGDVLALDARDGRVLYRFNAGGSVTGGVISYAVADRQYVAVVSGMAAAMWQAQPGSATLIIFGLP